MAFDKIDLLPATVPEIDSSFERFQRENLAMIAKAFSGGYEEYRQHAAQPSFEEMFDRLLKAEIVR